MLTYSFAYTSINTQFYTYIRFSGCQALTATVWSNGGVGWSGWRLVDFFFDFIYDILFDVSDGRRRNNQDDADG